MRWERREFQHRKKIFKSALTSLAYKETLDFKLMINGYMKKYEYPHQYFLELCKENMCIRHEEGSEF